ncbi:hypothetical protein BH09PAT1_BH09PAT1_8780 [soil metagenome]
MKTPTLSGNANRRIFMGVLFIFFFLGFTLFTYTTVKQWVKGQVAGQTLEVSPPSQELSIDPGDTTRVKAKITNQSNKSVTMSVHIEDFSASGDEGQVALSQGGQYSVTSWAKVTPSSFTLGPNEEQEVTATISVPKSAAGGRYGSFVFAVKAPEATGNAATVSQQIASLFLLRINGAVNERLAITEMSSPTFQEFGPVKMNIKFENTGNVHVKTYGLINVRDVFGNKVADIVVPGTNVFPDAARIVQSSLNKMFLIGPYTATALMYYGSQNDVLTAQTTFYVFPVRIVVVILVVIIIIFLLRKRLRKAFKAMTK